MMTTHDEISQDVPAMFPVTAETDVNIAYTHATRKVVNKYYMDKYAALQDDGLFIAAPTDTEEDRTKCQDVTLFAGAPLIAIKTLKNARIFNAEMFVVESFYRPPTGWHYLTLMQMKEVAHMMGACSSGTKKEIAESIEYVGVAVHVRNLRSGAIIPTPMTKFHELFRVAYCITVHQSQGQTIREKYTIYDWNLKFLRDEERARAKYVALSRGTRKDHVQIDTSDADVYDDKVLAT
ncbi:hypothetical protein AB1Y20_022332 [Prymnesium parvum]|uniref:ATP-dependent DNA helicase n=1 Tax=Prymnesium parvum TaxID=97485 RepID=A0AB34JH79_PRYPA